MHIVITVLAILAFVAYKIFDFVREKRESRKNKKSKKIKSSNMRLATLLAKDTLGEADLDEIDQIMEDMESELDGDNDGGESGKTSSTKCNIERIEINDDEGKDKNINIKKDAAANEAKHKSDIEYEKKQAQFRALMNNVKRIDHLTEQETKELKTSIDAFYREDWVYTEDFNRHVSKLWGQWIKNNQLSVLKVTFFEEYDFEDVDTVTIEGKKYGNFREKGIESYYDKVILDKIAEDSVDSYKMLSILAESIHTGTSLQKIQEYLDNHTVKVLAQNPVRPISVNAKIISGEECYFYDELSWVIQRKWQGSPYLDFDNASSVKVYVVKNRIEMLGEAIGHHTIWFEHILDSSISSPDKCPGSLFTIYVRGGKPVFITGERKQIIDLASVVYSLSSDSQKEMVPENSAFEEDSVAVKKEESVLEASPEVEIQPSLQTMNSNQVVDVLERIANVKALIPRNGINKQWIYKQGKALVHEVYLDGSNSDNNLAADLIFDDNGGAKLLLFTRQYDVNKTKEILEDKNIWGDVNNPAFMGDRYVYKEFPVGTSDEEIARYMEDFVNKMVAYRDKHSL